MKKSILILLVLFPTLLMGQTYFSHEIKNDRLIIKISEGQINLIPLSDKVIRVQFEKASLTELPELILTEKIEPINFKVMETDSFLNLHTNKIIAKFNKFSGKLSFIDKNGNLILSENSRKLTESSIMEESCYIAEQSFDSPLEEKLFGLGQFQDGYFNIKGLSRRLTQVNTQIAIPFLISNMGYGLLWHQYGLTDYNPADNMISLERGDQSGNINHEAEVTTSSGTQKLAQNQVLYQGKFEVPEAGEYSIFLDLGDMGNRHFVVIDGKPIIDQSNMWLPPTVGAFINLNSGEHKVQLICKSDNHPKLFWNLINNTTCFRSPHTKKIDYVVFYGPSVDSIISDYRKLTGIAPLFPQWAYGFWQCRERYTSGKNLVETVKEFRKRKLPMDVIVQDWQYWGNKGWGVPQFDDVNYSNPSGFIKEIHDLNAHFNISIWSNPDKNSAIGKDFLAKNRFIPNTKWLDYFNPETRKEYWNTLKNNLFIHGVDSWWMDATEPENDALKGEKTFLGAGNFFRLTYPYMVSKAVYEGQRETSSDKRVCILTRSAFLGQQKFGIINWSGDIGGTWDAFRRQIVAGLNYTITGFPYWTTDIGGFFRPGPGQYTDEKYQELLIRWFQWGTFNPIFRIHGYMSETEPWKFGVQVEDYMREMLTLRYRLLPYIYSEAWQVTKNNSTIMRPLIMDFNEDSTAINQAYEFMFGKAFLVAPITEPSAKEWYVYLPKSCAWYDFWSGEKFEGGKTIKTMAPLDKIPLFVKAGSIVPMGKFIEYVGQKTTDTVELRVYTGANGKYELYEDEGNNYSYENGNYNTIIFLWNEDAKTLTISPGLGNYKEKMNKRIFKLVFVNKAEGNGIPYSSTSQKQIVYSGKKIIFNNKPL